MSTAFPFSVYSRAAPPARAATSALRPATWASRYLSTTRCRDARLQAAERGVARDTRSAATVGMCFIMVSRPACSSWKSEIARLRGKTDEWWSPGRDGASSSLGTDAIRYLTEGSMRGQEIHQAPQTSIRARDGI
ncbi:hypothetical protein VTK73DRAFT_5950 [Phialemonium thermophilum]|uniref:Uncharacterized protein n=1 Tax=Phialemonium thermophilum TaxID=223376 RepID=A0ABR3V0H1_9PEZI